MRIIDTLIIHCSATPEGLNFTAADIDRWHRQRGFREIGYHYIIRLDGTIETGRAIEKTGAHCKNWNARSIGICYIGGLDRNGHPADTRTPTQKRAMKELIDRLRLQFPSVQTVIGHRDTSPDLNGNGQADPQEFIKSCPCFSVREWLRNPLAVVLLCVSFLLPFASSCAGQRTATSVTKENLATESSQQSIRQESADTARHTQRQDTSRLLQGEEEYTEHETICWNTPDSTHASFTRTVSGRRRFLVSGRSNQTDTILQTHARKEDSQQQAEHLQQQALTEKNEEKKRRNATGISTVIMVVMGITTICLIRKKRQV